MIPHPVKALLAAALVVAVSKVSKRGSLIGGLSAALTLTLLFKRGINFCLALASSVAAILTCCGATVFTNGKFGITL